jgi:SAM-dependent methyltransferase
MDPAAYREMAETEQGHWWFVGRRSIIEDKIEALHLKAGADILEVGAGTGGNLKLLSRFGNVTAVEMDEYARKHAMTSTGHKVHYGMLPSPLPVFETKFDLICMFDVLEHVEFDLESLVVLKNHLKPGGKILITVPAYQWMWSDHDVVLHHYRRYTKASLNSVLKSAGLKADRIGYFNMMLLPVAAGVRLIGKVFGLKGSPGAAYSPGVTNNMLTAIFRTERPVLRKMMLPAGLSVMAIASVE